MAFPLVNQSVQGGRGEQRVVSQCYGGSIIDLPISHRDLFYFLSRILVCARLLSLVLVSLVCHYSPLFGLLRSPLCSFFGICFVNFVLSLFIASNNNSSTAI
jgi:hypothetical protein